MYTTEHQKKKKTLQKFYLKKTDFDLLIKYEVAKIRALEEYASLIAAVQGEVETTLGQTVPISIREKRKSCKQVRCQLQKKQNVCAVGLSKSERHGEYTWQKINIFKDGIMWGRGVIVMV